MTTHKGGISTALLPPIRSDLTIDGVTDSFARTWRYTSQQVLQALATHGIQRGDHTDARALDTLLTIERLGFQADVMDKAMDITPPGMRTADTQDLYLEELRAIAHQAKRVPSFADLPVHIRQHLNTKAPPEILQSISMLPPKQLVRWRTITPPDLVGSAEGAGSTVQVRKLENELAFRWRQRILLKLKPHFQHFPNFSQWLQLEGLQPDAVEQTLHDTFGNTRWSTLAQHGRHLDKMMELNPSLLPWSTISLCQLFTNMREANRNRDKPYTPGTPLAYWTTAYYLADLTGTLDQINLKICRNTRDAVRASFITHVEHEDHRALAPTLAVVEATEKATRLSPTWADRWYASICRHGMGSSGRFNDYQHCSTKSLRSTARTSELSAWQTKATDLMDNRRAMPMIAPKITFAGEAWWEVFEEGMQIMVKKLGHRDWIIPAPTPNRRGVKGTPLRNGQAITWYRKILTYGGLPEEEAKKQTLSGWRVFMPELAFQAGIPRDQRRYLGRWQHENMADQYTREHRNVILDIWSEVCRRRDHGDLSTVAMGQQVPCNLTDDHYDIPHSNFHKRRRTRPGDSSSPPSPTDGPCEEPEVHMQSGDKWNVLPTSCHPPKAAPKARAAPTPDKQTTPPEATPPPQTVIARPENTRLPIDLVTPDQSGPLMIYGCKKNTRSSQEATPSRKCHLLRQNGRTVCGWNLNKDAVIAYHTELDYLDEVSSYRSCWVCWKRYTTPTTWSSAGPPPDTYTAPGSSTQLDDPDLVHSEEELSLCDTSSSAPSDTDDEIIEIESEARGKSDQ